MEETPEKLAEEFLAWHKASGGYMPGHITRLAELATSPDPSAAEMATRAIFASLVEPLADSFEPMLADLYERLFSQIIQFCRRTLRGGGLDHALSKFGLESEKDLRARVSSVQFPSAFDRWWGAKEVRLVIILSRVTLGADVAVTSVMIERAKRKFPGASLVLVGGRKAAELFGGDARLSFREIDYQRSGATIDRLLSWLNLLKVVEELTEGFGGSEYVVIDPDSRLTQLGLLPVSPDENYLLFPSRSVFPMSELSLGRIASDWLDLVFGETAPASPSVSLNPSDIEAAARVVSRMRGGSARPVIAINFGVGGNALKRVSDEFEQELVRRLIEGGARVILDKGAGEEEELRADGVVRYSAGVVREGRAVRVVEIDEAGLSGLLASDWEDADFLVWSGRIGLLAALIGESDLYIGYDSAGQHIAAALSVPCIDVFAGYGSRRMLDRWKPEGQAESRVIPVDAPSAQADAQAILSAVLSAAREMLPTR